MSENKKAMKEIKIGTCIPGQKALEWTKPMIDLGYEAVAVNFHMSFGDVDIVELAPKLKEILADKAYVGALGFYCNALQYEEHKENLIKCIDNAHLFGTKIVSTFAGALEGESVETSMPKFKEVFSELAKRAEDKGVRLAIENCPMGGTWNKATCNIGFNPKAWEMMFGEVNSNSLGLEWEPAHQMGQLIEPIPNLKQWINKVVHLHGKDATIDWDEVKRFGVISKDEFAYMRLPGFGDTNWRDIFFMLYQHGFEGDICVEGYHDPIYAGDWEMTGQKHALSYLKWARGGDFTNNPW